MHVFLVDYRQSERHSFVRDILQRNPSASDVVTDLRLRHEINTFINEVDFEAMLPLVVDEFLVIIYFIALGYAESWIVTRCCR